MCTWFMKGVVTVTIKDTSDSHPHKRSACLRPNGRCGSVIRLTIGSASCHRHRDHYFPFYFERRP